MWAPTSVRICTLSPSYARSIGVYGSSPSTPNCGGGKLKQSVLGAPRVDLAGRLHVQRRVGARDRSEDAARGPSAARVGVPMLGFTRNGGGSLR